MDQTREEQYFATLDQENLEGLWRIIMKLLPKEPVANIEPVLWRWETLEKRLDEAAEFVGIERGGERRVLLLVNPALKGRYATTHTLAAAVQLVMPGEIAPAHRHTPAAIRFIVRGSGAYTVVEGEKIPMEVGDLTLTPTWTWHDHGNDGKENIYWLDGLDFPLTQSLNTIFFELYPQMTQPQVKPNGYTSRRAGAGMVKLLGTTPEEAVLPVIYRWKDCYPPLREQMETEGNVGDGFDGVVMEYTNPLNGGHTMPTLSCWLQGLRPGEQTRAHRHTGSSIYLGVRGRGTIIMNGKRMDWGPGDCFALPPWIWHEHANASRSEEAVLFSFHDRPMLDALRLYREEAHSGPHGRQ
jgi:gentisate 1,2-dioxygenase